MLLTSEEQKAALKQTRINAVWGVGGAYAQKLISQGITSAWDLSNMPPGWARQHLGGVVGLRLIRELRGEPSIGTKEELTEKKMIATTRMFGKPVKELHELKEAVATYISRAAEKLRRQSSATRIITVFLIPKVSGQPFDYNYAQMRTVVRTLPHPTSLTQALIQPAMEMVTELYENGQSYSKAGVMLGGLTPDDSIQGSLFAAGSPPARRHLMDSIDNINFSMRDDMIKFGAAGLQKNWKMRQELRSGRYSTRWNDLLEVR
jgi:DNA polymerase V